MKFSVITALAVFGSNLLYLIHLLRPLEPSEECQEEMLKVDRCMHEAAAVDPAWAAGLDSTVVKMAECLQSKIDAGVTDPAELQKCQEMLLTYIESKCDLTTYRKVCPPFMNNFYLDIVEDLKLERIAEEVVAEEFEE